MLSSLLALALAAGPVSVQFEGPLKQGLSVIAEKGGLNVIVVGELSEPAQLHLTDVTAEEALETVAKVYQLEVTKQGKLYVLRRPATNAQAVPAPVTAAPPAPPPLAPSLVVETTPGKDGTSPEVKQLLTEVEKLEAEQRRLEHETERLTEEAERREELAAERDEKLNELVEKKVEHDKVQSRVKGQAVSAGSPVVIAAGESVKDAVAYGGPVVVESGARVTGDAVAFGGDVVLKDRATVDGDAVSFGGRVVREGSATVRGEEVSFGGAGLVSSMAAHAAKASNAASVHEQEKSGGLSIATFLVQFVVFFVFGFLLMVFAPQRMKGLESAVRGQPVLSGVVGFLALVVALPLTLFLLITLIGIPVAALLWLALALVVPMGLAAIANTVGTAMPLGRVRRTQAMVLAIGLLALLLVAQVPVLGPLMLSLAVCVSLGAVLRTRLGATPKGLPITESVERIHG